MEHKFKPFDKVLVRNSEMETWKINFFKYYDEQDEYNYHCFVDEYVYCIPFDGNEHLLGTTDNYVDPFEPKDGDFVICEGLFSKNKYIAIYHSFNGYSLKSYAIAQISAGLCDVPCFSDERHIKKEFAPATEEEKQMFLYAFHNIGKDWDAEKKSIIDYVPPYEPKDGDFIAFGNASIKTIQIFKEMLNENQHSAYVTLPVLPEYNAYSNELCYWSNWVNANIRRATEKEKQILLTMLHKEGKDWDATKKEIKAYKWKPVQGETVLVIEYNDAQGRFIPVEWQCDWKDPKSNAYYYGIMFKAYDNKAAFKYTKKLNIAIKNIINSEIF